MTDVVATRWEQALHHLFANSWQSSLRRFRSTFAYRGVGDVQDALCTRLARITDDPCAIEQHLLRNFRKYAQDRPELRFDSLWHWLSLAQHHGLPTRLLDWTYSPLVALHFTTEARERFAEDGVVWCVDYVAAKKLLPSALAAALHDDGADVFTPELLARTVKSFDEIDTIAPDPALVFLEPPALDQRIVTQYALFSFLTRGDADMTDWAEGNPGLCRKVVITARAKCEIRDQLDQANVTERVLYPGLDGLCQWLARYYERR